LTVFSRKGIISAIMLRHRLLAATFAGGIVGCLLPIASEVVGNLLPMLPHHLVVGQGVGRDVLIGGVSGLFAGFIEAVTEPFLEKLL